MDRTIGNSPLFCTTFEKPGGWGPSARGVVASYTDDGLNQIPTHSYDRAPRLLNLVNAPQKLYRIVGNDTDSEWVFCLLLFLGSVNFKMQFMTQAVIPPFSLMGLSTSGMFRPLDPLQIPLAKYFIS